MKLRRVQTELFNHEMRRPSGQALVEFALALPVVLLLVFGVLEIGRVFRINIVLENAAREGAHYFIYNTSDASEKDINNNYFNFTRQAVDTELNEETGIEVDVFDKNQVIVKCLTGSEVDPYNVCPVGSTIEVTVIHDFDFAVYSYFFGPIKLHGNARMLVP